MPDYEAKSDEYKTIQGDMWDIIAWRQYGDEHAMHCLQDANFYQRFTDAFPASVILEVPPKISIHFNLKSGVQIPSLDQLLPWR